MPLRLIGVLFGSQVYRHSARLQRGVILNIASDLTACLYVLRMPSFVSFGREAHRVKFCAALELLCSDVLSSMNGQIVVIDGGKIAW